MVLAPIVFPIFVALVSSPAAARTIRIPLHRSIENSEMPEIDLKKLEDKNGPMKESDI